ncbi:N-acetylmuramic acid 6-phosphate etherase [Curtobacterium luteum]|uniref:N-acetylmuramic acid 6-phosphate etherase n=1 Tax=Curtobacterium luteum TaxID=33881 RepID=UPI0037F33059
MSADVHDAATLDTLATEASDGIGIMLGQLPTAALTTLMNDGDATIAAAVRETLPHITTAIDGAAARMRQGGRLLYVGAGTSGRLGILDASEIPPTFGTSDDVVIGIIAGGPTAIVNAVEAAEDNADAGAADIDLHVVGPLDTVVGIASSGRTPYVIGALRRAAMLGALTVGVSCNRNAPVTVAANIGIEVIVGPEVVTGSTRLRAGTATKMVINMISTITMIRLGKTYGTLMVDVKATNDKLRHRARRIVATATGAPASIIEESLDAADWHAKTAIAMIALHVGPEEARTALGTVDGFLDRLITKATTR